VCLKKKYRQVQCTYCTEFVPQSPWSVLQARRFESAVLADHDRSSYHQKALHQKALAAHMHTHDIHDIHDIHDVGGGSEAEVAVLPIGI
jgi:hypothetical protein